jgi:hypothetical protein
LMKTKPYLISVLKTLVVVSISILLSFMVGYYLRQWAIYSVLGLACCILAIRLINKSLIFNFNQITLISIIFGGGLALIKRRSNRPSNGYFDFEVNPIMKIGQSEKIRADVFYYEELLKGRKNNGNIDTIQITESISAKLVCYNDFFEIKPINNYTQVITALDTTYWEWDVIPLKAGFTELVLIFSLSMPSNQFGTQLKDLEPIKRTSLILNNRKYLLRKWYKNNWQWLISLLFGSGLIFGILKSTGVIK